MTVALNKKTNKQKTSKYPTVSQRHKEKRIEEIYWIPMIRDKCKPHFQISRKTKSITSPSMDFKLNL